MAPFKNMKTYQNPKKPKPLTKSETEINDILINLTNIGISPEKSYDALRETTFDRLLKGQNYNDVVLVKYPKNHFPSSGEFSYSILECSKNNTRDDIGRSNSNNIKPVACESYVSFSHISDQDVQTDASLNEQIKSSIHQSPINTRSQSKLQQSSNIQSTFSQCVSNLQETNRSTSIQSILSTNNESEFSNTDVSKHISLKQSLEDKLVKTKKFQYRFHLNISGFKLELLKNKGSTPVISNSVKLERRKGNHKFKTFRSIKNSILNTSIGDNTRRLTEENYSSVNISYLTPVKTIERNKIIQEELSSMTCSSLQKNERTKSEHFNIVNNQQNYTSFQNSSLSNPYLVLTSTPLHKSKSIFELIDISSENETEFSVSKPTSHFNSNKSQLAWNNLPNEVKNFTESELPNCSFLHVENDNNKQNKSSCSDKISKNKTRNLKYSEDELQTESQYENNVLIEDKYVDRSNIDQIEMDTCSKLEINSNSVENNSEDYDFVDTSITAQQPLMKKYVSLAAGKKFRRSIIIHKNSMDSSRNLKGDDSSDSIKYPKPKRTSIKVVPVTPMKAKMSRLENYAVVQEEGIEDNFDEPLPSVNFNLTNHMKQSIIPTSARNIVLQRCMQTEPLTFDNCYPPSVLEHCQKIGEGVYGEVFMYRDESSSLTVMKIIPIEGDQIVNLEKQKTFEEIISEIIISAELSNLRKNKCNKTEAFTEVKKIRCVKGSYPQRLLELWDLYDENKHSENDSPEIFHSDQLYIVLELSNGGRDLEAFEFKNAQQSLAVFHQIACAIAVAEEELNFEHRDLHWGNVLVQVTTQKYSNFVLKGKEIAVNNKDLKATIIDFTLSRIEYEGVVIFNDLALDNDLFSAIGDYQFEVYRLMQKNNGNEWLSFNPYSNVLWLHYILDKAISAFRYKNIRSKLHKTSLLTLKEYKERILDYRSVTEFVIDDFVER